MCPFRFTDIKVKLSSPKNLAVFVPFFIQFGREFQGCFFKKDGIPSISLVSEHSLIAETCNFFNICAWQRSGDMSIAFLNVVYVPSVLCHLKKKNKPNTYFHVYVYVYMDLYKRHFEVDC